jgi:hypothetical protein
VEEGDEDVMTNPASVIASAATGALACDAPDITTADSPLKLQHSQDFPRRSSIPEEIRPQTQETRQTTMTAEFIPPLR